MKQILLLVLTCCLGFSIQAQTYNAAAAPGSPIPDASTFTTTIVVPISGTIGADTSITVASLDLTHTFDGDLEISLISPEGTSLSLSLNNGGAGDDYIGTVFQDGAGDISLASPPFTGAFEPQGGPFNTVFAGEQIMGDWTLNILDEFAGDSGNFGQFSLTFNAGDSGGGDCSVAYSSTSLPKSVPVSGSGTSTCATATTDILNVAESGVIGTTAFLDSIGIDITHTFDNDLEISLIAPSGASIDLSSDNGGAGDNYTNTVFVNSGAPNITSGVAPFTGQFVPESGSMNANLNGEEINGPWTLFVCDDLGGDIGQLNEFDLFFTLAGVSGPPTAICQDITVELDKNGIAAIDSLALDDGSLVNCGMSADYRVLPDTFRCGDLGDQMAELIVTDDMGLMDTCEAIITVIDSPPVFGIDSGALDITVYVEPGATDSTYMQFNGCSASVGMRDTTLFRSTFNLTGSPINPMRDYILTWPLDSFQIMDGGMLMDTVYNPFISTFSCDFSIGCEAVHTHGFIVADICGNISEEFIITMTFIDRLPPIAQCMDITVELDDMGNAMLDSLAVDDGSYSNCNTVVAHAVSPNSFTCDDLGDNMVELVVTDDNDHSDTCIAIVTVVDTTSPEAICADITVTLDGFGLATIDSASADDGSRDACGIASITLEQLDFTCADFMRMDSLLMTVEDSSGNSSTCYAGLVVEGTDADMDNYVAECEDCNDMDPLINPGVDEICGDGIDNNCDDEIDDFNALGYCCASGTNPNSYIDFVRLAYPAANTIKFVQSGPDPFGYGDYSDPPANIAQINANAVYFSVKPGMNRQTYIRLWVDWDQNGEFDTYEMVAQRRTNNTWNGQFFIPGPFQGIPAQYFMRIAASERGFIADPCVMDAPRSEFEDYMICVANDCPPLIELTSGEENVIVDSEWTVAISPNPFANELYLQITLPSISAINVKIFDQTGREVINHNSAGKKGANKLSIPTETIPNGVYFVKITSEDGVIERKVIKTSDHVRP